MLHVGDGDVLQRVCGGILLYFAILNGAEGAEARAVTCAGAGVAGAGAAGSTDTKMAPREWARRGAGRAGAGCWAAVGGSAGLEPLGGNVPAEHGRSAGIGC